MQSFSKSEHLSSLLALIIAILAVGLAPIFIRFSEAEIDPLAVVFHRCWIPILPLSLLFICQKSSIIRKDEAGDSVVYTAKDILLLAISGLSFWTWNILWVWSLTATTVANSTLLHNLTALFTPLGGWLIWRRRLDRQFVLGMVFALGGAASLNIQDFQLSPQCFAGDFLAFSSALFYSGSLVLTEALRRKFTAAGIVFWNCSIAAVLSLPVFAFSQDSIFPATWQGYVWIAALALVSQLLGQGLMAYSLKNLSSAFVSLSDLADPVLATVEAWLIFHETLDWLAIVAFAVVLVGFYVALSSEASLSADRLTKSASTPVSTSTV